MTDPRARLRAYADDVCRDATVNIYEETEVERERAAPAAFAALEAVMNACDREDDESIGLIGTDTIRRAILDNIPEVPSE